MTALLDGRPPGLDAFFRPAKAFAFTLTWPAGHLAGRTYTATLDAAALTVAIDGDSMAITATAAQTTAAGEDAHAFVLTEVTGDLSEPVVIGSWSGSLRAATSSSATVEVATSAGQVAIGVAASPAAGEVVHDWDLDGWEPFTEQLVSNDGAATSAYSVVTSGRGRITGQAAATDGNRRTWMLREGTLWADSEVCSLWWGGSAFDPDVAFPQMGHVHRAVEDPDGTWTAWVVTNNIFLSNPNVVNQNIWETDGAALTLGSNGGSKNFDDALNRKLAVVSVERTTGFGLYFNNYRCTPTHLYGMVNGDVVTADTNDATFDLDDVAVNGVSLATGNVQIIDSVTAETAPLAVAFGTITPAPVLRYWPYWVRSQLRGTVLRVKVWRYMDPEPDWGSAGNVVVFDTANADPGDPAPGIDAAPAGPGLCGLVGAHLRSAAYMEYGETSFRDLRGT